jgi:hypothetical protein
MPLESEDALTAFLPKNAVKIVVPKDNAVWVL